MDRIRKVRVVPPKFTLLGKNVLTEEVLGELKAGSMFLYLCKKYGKPEVKNGSYMFPFRYKNVVFAIMIDGSVSIETWIAPMYRLLGDKRRTKVRNVIARKVNSQGIVFMPEGDFEKCQDGLYFAVRQKNKALYDKRKAENLVDIFYESVTEDEEEKVCGGLLQHLPETEAVIREFYAELQKPIEKISIYG